MADPQEMAAAARGNQRLRYVELYRFLIVAALVIGDIGAAGLSSPPPTLMRQAEQLQGLDSNRSPSVEAPPPPCGWTTAPAGGTRRLLVGSRAPTCTYNECRGCRHRCSVREVPVDAKDPLNSAYHYRCVCHI